MSSLHTPAYSPTNCKIGVIHVGLGAFHRAHQAFYFDAMMERTGDLGWGIAAVNMRAPDSNGFDKAAVADGYVLQTINGDGVTDYRHIRAHIHYADWAKDAAAAANLAASPDVQAITITVTESGYCMTENGNLNTADGAIAAEIAGKSGTTIYAYLRAALRARKTSNAGPITVMCCDNLRYNGTMLGRNFRSYLAACGDHDLLAWIEQNTSFPCSMVDRITPKPKPELADEISAKFGVNNVQAVLSEDFIQWVLEDNFAGRRPALDAVGVEIVEDVEPFEETKIRVLNGGHTGLTYLGALKGIKTFDRAMADPELAAHFDAYQTTEVLPALGDDMPLDLNSYLDKIRERFNNSNIADTVERICMDGVSKFSIFILPTVHTCFENGKVPKYGIRSIASWYVFARRIARGEMQFNYLEPNLDVITPYFDDETCRKFATSEQLWRDLPSKFPAFVSLLTAEIEQVEKDYPVLVSAK